MKKEELSKLISGLVDARLTAEEQAQLEIILEKDREARRLYRQYIDLEVDLGSTLISQEAPLRAEPKVSRAVWWQLAAAAVLMLGLSLGILLVKRPSEKPTDLASTAHANWDADFENGNTEGWVGQWTTNAAPGGNGALTSITLTNSHGVFHQLRTPERWDEGIFRIDNDTHLHFVYRVETPKWFDIFFTSRSRNPAEPEVVLHIFRNPQLWSEPGRWRRATVPLSLFKRKVEDRFADISPVVGEAPVQLFFSAEENGLQLTIDRIWVTRGGPGKFEINEAK